MLREYDSVKQMRFLCLMCCMAYFVSYLTRLDYAVCMVEIQQALQVGKDFVGLPVTVCFLSYGVGQVIFGFMGDRFMPQKMVFVGVVGSAACNLLVILLPKMEMIVLLWCINGIFQSMLWPPLVRIMAENLNEDWYRKSCVRVSLSSSIATIVLYMMAPICIQISGWKSVFCVSAIGGGFVSVVWYWGTKWFEIRQTTKSIGTEKYNKHSEMTGRQMKTFGISIVLFLLAIVLHGTLKDGITTWMSVYMSEMFGMNNSQSILSAVILPVCSVLSTLLSSALLYRLKNEVLTASLPFGTGTIAGMIMVPVYDSHPTICVMMMTLITGCMFGVNLMLISRIPGHFAAHGNVSAVSGVLNAATYVGSAFSIYGFGTVAEKAGWMPVVMMWGMIALGGTLLLASEVRIWATFSN